MTQPIKPDDLFYLLVEKPHAGLQISIVFFCTRPAGAPRSFVRDLVAQWRQQRGCTPPFNYRYRPLPIPAWEELPDAEVDLDYHLRHSALPEPGGERELGELISRLHAQRLDLTRPLWECHVIEGLENDRFALYVKLHHSQFDGVAGLRLFDRAFSKEPDAPQQPPFWALPQKTGAKPATRRPDLLAKLRAQLGSLQPVGAVMAGMLREGRSGGHSDLALPFGAPKTPINGRIRAARRFAKQRYELARIKRIAKQGKATVNDVFLTITAGALRRYLQEHHHLPEQTLTAGLPVSVRPAGEAELGNAITLMLAKLYTDTADPRERLAAVGRSTRAAKEQLEKLPKAAIENYTLALVGPYLVQLAFNLGGLTRPIYNLVLSNVPGPDQPWYVNGARIDELYPLTTLAHGQALMIAVGSYAGQFLVGFTGCRDSLPHMQKLAVYMGEALDELEAAVA